jgi:hypothetical protein
MIKRIQKKYRSLKKENEFSGIADDPKAKMEPTPLTKDYFCNICNTYFNLTNKSLNIHIKTDVIFLNFLFLVFKMYSLGACKQFDAF